MSDELKLPDNDEDRIRQTMSDEFGMKGTTEYLRRLLLSCSFSHIVELIKLEEQTKRKFYELLILKSTPSVRELQRQINTLTFERLGFSQNKELALKQIKSKIIPELGADLIKSHYFFEFLNFNQPHLIEESELEQALISHLQEFIIELGNGFCFEARQKRILIGDEYFFIDLVFYHRILKCHVLVELKTEKANHEHIGQLKTYINYYKKNCTLPNDNPPVGILLVTSQNKTLVEYAVADSDKDIFVSQYLLQLPDKEQLITFINKEILNL
jgi:predicted nuclease of restriction endonuclease-like (RecB) superfamily